MLETVERGVSGVQRELATSLGTFERNLLQETRTHLRDHLRHTGHSMTVRQLQEFLNQFMQERCSTWSHNAGATLRRRAEELAGDMEALLQGPDWALLNKLVAQQHLSHQYPQDLLSGLRLPTDAVRDLNDSGQGGEWLRGQDTDLEWSGEFLERRFVLQTHWLGALCGGALTAATAYWLLPFRTLVHLLGAGTGALGGAYVSRQLIDAPAIDLAMSRVEQAIVRTAQQALESLNGFTREVASRVRTTLEEQFAQIESVTAQATAETQSAAPTSGNEGAISLKRLREAVQATTPSP